MNISKLKVIAGAGDPDDALALRIDVVAAAEEVVRRTDEQIKAKADQWLAMQSAVDEAVLTLYSKTKRYMKACKRRARA